MSANPSEVDVLKTALRGALGAVHTAIPGEIVSYDDTTQTATVQVVIKSAYLDALTEEVVRFLPPAIPNVPVAWPSSGSCSIHWPLAAGDPVLLIVAERSTDEWRTTTGSEHEPRDLRRFDLSDAVALPGCRSPADPIPAAGIDATALVVRGDAIKLGSASASDLVALKSLVEAELQSLRNEVATHVHPVPGIVPGAGSTTSSAPTAFSTAVGNTGATKVKAE